MSIYIQKGKAVSKALKTFKEYDVDCLINILGDIHMRLFSDSERHHNIAIQPEANSDHDIIDPKLKGVASTCST